MSMTACPEACQTGVNFVGTNCTGAINLAYVHILAAQQGMNFTLADFDPEVLPLCGVLVSNSTFSTAYQTGQLQFISSVLQKYSATVPECDFNALLSGSFPQAWGDCKSSAISGVCTPSCANAITAGGSTCLLALGKALTNFAPGVYAAEMQVFEACGINPLAPAPAPAPIAAISPPLFSPPQAPVSSSASPTSVAFTALVSAVIALLLL